MWYALAKRQDLLSESVNRFIALASCVFPEPYPGLPLDFNGLMSIFNNAYKLGVYNVYGDDESSDNLFRLFCRATEDPLICAGYDVAELIGFDSWGAEA